VCGPLIERDLGSAIERDGRRGGRGCGRLALFALRHGQELGNAVVELGNLLDESCELHAQRRILGAQRFDVELDDHHGATRSHAR
jgi:hypothetical protein